MQTSLKLEVLALVSILKENAEKDMIRMEFLGADIVNLAEVKLALSIANILEKLAKKH